jgi:hypothetical protein
VGGWNPGWVRGLRRVARSNPVPPRAGRWIALASGALLAGAGLGFVARDLLGLGQPAVALAWLAGFALGISTVRRRE